MERSSDFSRRVGIILLAVFAVAALFIGRLVVIQVFDAGRLNAEAEDRRSLTREQLGIRGSIVDANGIVLAESVERYDITASPRHANEFLRDGATVSVDQALAEIAAVTGGRVSEMRDSLAEDPTANFAYLVKSVTIAQLRDVQALSIPWTYYDLRPSRTYPRGAVAGNLVGFMGTDGPLTGVEYYQNTCLDATNGTMTFARGSDGIRIPGSTVNAVEPVDGGKIQLTIDSDLQWFAQKLIHARGNELDAKWATAMVVRISDGHILAAADWPSVDPNNVNGSKVDDMGARLFSVPYEPGSVFKPIILAAMIDRGLLSPRDEFLVPSQFEVSKSQFIADYFPHGTLQLTATGILTSCWMLACLIFRYRTEQRPR